MSEVDWKVTGAPDGSEGGDPDCFTATADDGRNDWRATVDRDGEVRVYCNGSPIIVTWSVYLDSMIERLTKLRDLALEKFGEDWREE